MLLTDCLLLLAGLVFSLKTKRIAMLGGLQSVRSHDDDKCCLQNKVRLMGRGEGRGLLGSPVHSNLWKSDASAVELN